MHVEWCRVERGVSISICLVVRVLCELSCIILSSPLHCVHLHFSHTAEGPQHFTKYHPHAPSLLVIGCEWSAQHCCEFFNGLLCTACEILTPLYSACWS